MATANDELRRKAGMGGNRMKQRSVTQRGKERRDGDEMGAEQLIVAAREVTRQPG